MFILIALFPVNSDPNIHEQCAEGQTRTDNTVRLGAFHHPSRLIGFPITSLPHFFYFKVLKLFKDIIRSIRFKSV
jgi:hypothetical protein